MSSPGSSPSPCLNRQVKDLSEPTIFFCKKNMKVSVYLLWEFKGQSQAPLSLKEVSQVQESCGIIIASRAHNLWKSSWLDPVDCKLSLVILLKLKLRGDLCPESVQHSIFYGTTNLSSQINIRLQQKNIRMLEWEKCIIIK